MPGGTVDALNVKISADISKLQSGLKKCMSQLTGLQTTTAKTANKMQSSFSKVGDSIKKVAGIIGAAFAVNEIKKFGKAAIDAASDLAEVQNVVDTVFGSMSDNINAWSQSAMKAFGLSETSAKQFTSTMGAMLKSSGITGKALETMSINMAALSADMASFYNLDSQTAFQKIRAGISGETEPLKQLGINMSVANLEAYALSKGITKSYQAMSQSEQMILRYNYLLTVTADAQHDFERTSSGWANQTRILAENFNRLKTIIGTGLIQALTPLLNMLNTLIAKIVEFAQAVAKAFGAGGEDGGMSGLSDDAAGTAEGLEDADKAAKKLNNTLGGIDELNIVGDNADTSSITDKLGNLKPISVYDTVGKGLDGISKKMVAFVDKLKEKLEPVAQLAKDIKQSFIDAFKGDLGDSLITNLKEGFWTLVDIVGAFAEAFDKAWTNNDNGTIFLESVGNALDTILGLANSVGQAIANALNSESGSAWIESVIQKWQSLFSIVDSIAGAIRAAFENNNAGQAFIDSILQKWTALNGAITAVQSTIASVFSSSIGQAFFDELIRLGTTFNGIVTSIANSFTQAWSTAGVGESIIAHILEIITSIVGSIADLGEHFRAAWEQNQVGETLMTTILGTIDSVLGVVDRLGESWRAVWDNDATTTIFTNILGTINAIVGAIGDMGDNLKNALSSTGADVQIFTALRDAIGGIASAAQTMAESLRQSMSGIDWAPIVAGAAALASAISNVVQAVAGLAGGVIAEFGRQIQDAFNSWLPGVINSVAGAFQMLASVIRTLDPGVVLRLVEAFIALKAAIAIGNVITSITSAFSSLTGSMGGVSSGMLQTAGVIVVVSTALAALAVAIEGVISAWDKLTGSTTAASSAMSSVSVPGLSTSSIPTAATGGQFTRGDIFIANERGPELVGAFGGGSGVMNNNQIVDAVSTGVASAISPLIENMQNDKQEIVSKIRGNDLLLVMQRASKQRGTTISNNFAFGGA